MHAHSRTHAHINDNAHLAHLAHLAHAYTHIYTHILHTQLEKKSKQHEAIASRLSGSHPPQVRAANHIQLLVNEQITSLAHYVR